MSDGWSRTGRGIENAVIIEIPGISDVSLRRRQGGRQRRVDVVAALTGLTLHAGGQSRSWRAESRWGRPCEQDEA